MDDWLSQYALAMNNLRAENLEKLKELVSEDIEFQDPFNHSFNRDAFIETLQDMFNKLEQVRFEVHEMLQQEQQAVLYWTFSANSRSTGPISVEGMSRIRVDSAGRVCLHQDFWDASQIMQQIPLIGRVIAWLRNKMACHPPHVD